MIRSDAKFQEPFRIPCDNSFAINYKTNDVQDEKVIAAVKPKAPCFTHLSNRGITNYRIVKAQVTKGLYGLSDLRPDEYYWQYTVQFGLTPKGIQESKTWKSLDDHWEIPMAQKELIEVTGIKTEEVLGTKGTIGEFTWKWAPNDVGQNPVLAQRVGLQIETRQGRAFFQHYDDGWRIESISWTR